MRMLWILLGLVLAGCAETPQQIIDDGIRFDITSKSAPRLAALCALRVAEAIETTNLSGTIREAERDGDYEVILHSRIDYAFPFAVIRTNKAADGSAIVVYLQRLSKYVGDELLARIRKSC